MRLVIFVWVDRWTDWLFDFFSKKSLMGREKKGSFLKGSVEVESDPAWANPEKVTPSSKVVTSNIRRIVIEYNNPILSFLYANLEPVLQLSCFHHHNCNIIFVGMRSRPLVDELGELRKHIGSRRIRRFPERSFNTIKPQLFALLVKKFHKSV